MSSMLPRSNSTTQRVLPPDKTRSSSLRELVPPPRCL
ncbi:hypothetical protein BS78_04G153500 [Paspalum vaginatum]|nr:hypothetical protein BS78_04G153500 [Paspalum vaginatum]